MAQLIVEVPNSTEFSLGNSDTAQLVMSYPNSPMNRSENPLRNAERKLTYKRLVQDNIIKNADGTASSVMWQFSAFNRDYNINMGLGIAHFDPSMATQEPGDPGGAPANAFVPTVISPGGNPDGPVNLDPGNLGTPPNRLQTPTSSPWPGGSATSEEQNPTTTSQAIGLSTIGDYMLGRHPAGTA